MDENSRFLSRPYKIITFLLLFQSNSLANSCPNLCHCGDQSGSKFVDCHNVNFTTLPSDIPVDTVSLFLSNTKITKFSANDFSRLSHLTKIELSNNKIENITDGVFNGLTKLETLNLPRNGIRRISSAAFAGLSSLRKLTLSNNELTSLPEGLLKDQTNLQTLSLDNNLLNSLPVGFLNSTIKLSVLHLNDNNITRIPNEMLQQQSKLTMLYLNKNQIERIEDKALVAAGSTLLMVKLEHNRLSSLPRALNELRSPFIIEIGLSNNLMTLIPQQDESLFEGIKNSRGKISLSGNPLACKSSLQWLQTWMNQNSGVIKDIDQVTCQSIDGTKTKLLEYDFNSTAFSSSAAPTTTVATTTVRTSTTLTTQLLHPTTHAPPLTTPKPQTTATINSTDTPTTILISHSLTRTSGTSTTEALTRTTVVVTKVPENVTRTQEMPASGTASSNQNTFTKPTPQRTDEADTKALDRNEHIILATCLSAAFIAGVVFVAMYCFRGKIIRRDKMLSSRYDRVRIV